MIIQKLFIFQLYSKSRLLTLNFRGESHDKGFAEDAYVKASEGVLCPLEAFVF
jgi:hypothetical protein